MFPIGKSGKSWRKVTQEERDLWRKMVVEDRLTLREVGRRVGREHRVIAYNIKERPVNPVVYRKPSRKRKIPGSRTLNHILYNAASMARRRSHSKGLPFDIDVPYLFSLYDSQQGRCAITGIPMELNQNSEYLHSPFVPSIDRIDSKRGYVRDNVRLTLWIVNKAMDEWGEECFAKIAKAYVALHPDQD